MENNNNENSQAGVVVAVAISTLALLGGMYYLYTQVKIENELTVSKIVQRVENLESEKVGGEENYKKLKQIYSNSKYREQQAQQLDGALKQMGGTTNDNSGEKGTSGNETSGATTSSLSPDYKEGQLTADKISSILKDSYFKGSESAKIVWLEYSDVECPYCKRFHQAGTIDAVMGKYEGKVKYSLQHFPLQFHANAQKGAEALECVGEIAGKDKFFEFETKVFSMGMDTQPTYEKLEGIAKDMKIDTKKLKTCVDSSKHASKISAQMNNGQTIFGVQGTPGNVLMNIETGKWVLVPGAYPASEIEKVIDYVSK